MATFWPFEEIFAYFLFQHLVTLLPGPNFQEGSAIQWAKYWRCNLFLNEVCFYIQNGSDQITILHTILAGTEAEVLLKKTGSFNKIFVNSIYNFVLMFGIQ